MKTGRRLAAALALALFSVPADSRLPGSYRSETRAVSIDGIRFVAAMPSADDGPPASVPFLGERLREAGEDAALPALALPRGLRAERTVRMEGVSGPVTVVLGRTAAPREPLLKSLRAAGWRIPARGPYEKTAAVATITAGKESRVVLMDEKEGRFLLVLRLEE